VIMIPDRHGQTDRWTDESNVVPGNYCNCFILSLISITDR